MRRREFIGIVGGAAAWPVVGRAQQAAMPLVGYLHSGSPVENSAGADHFRRGLGEAGFVEGHNVTIAFRWAENQPDRLPALAQELVRLQCAVIAVGGGGRGQQEAKAATSTIPIVFTGGFDPVAFGLVASLNRPGGNITGTTFLSNSLEAKRLGLLHDLVPQATTIGVLINPDNASSKTQLGDLQDAAKELGLRLYLQNASSEADFDPAFSRFIQNGVGALLVGTDAFYVGERGPIVALAARYAIPAIYNDRQLAMAGGLISYGADLLDGYRQMGIYVGRILKGEKPADMPVQQSSKFELVINLKTVKTLGLEVPANLLALADEVIE